jgi:alcohol dehydrogenase class IV
MTNYRHDFRAVGYAVRLYSGKDALENLPAEVKRHKRSRAFIVCGRSVSRKTPLIDRMRGILGESCAGVFDEMAKESPLSAVLGARDAARAANADMLIAVGAGSVIQATRVVAVLLAEKAPVEELITQYPASGPAISPKLMAPKLPIVNVLTAATSAQNRAGSAVKGENLDHRMEFFDPKTRPVAVFWDSDALLTAPASLARNTGAAVFWRSVMNMGAASMSPLVEGDRLQALRLARGALSRLSDPNDAGPRIELCAAAYLQNREADDGGTLMEKHWVGRVVYAFAAALFHQHGHVAQGEANNALTPGVMRRLGHRDPEAMCRIASALDVWREGDPVQDAPERAAAALEQAFRTIGTPTRLSQLDIPRESLPAILEHSLKNFNADPKREFVRERDLLLDVLESTW